MTLLENYNVFIIILLLHYLHVVLPLHYFMTNYWESLDIQAQQLRNSYLIAFQKGDYIVSAHRLYVRNLALPEGARISDMPPFDVPAYGFNHNTKTKGMAFEYCRKWEGLIEMSTTVYRSSELDSLNRI